MTNLNKCSLHQKMPTSNINLLTSSFGKLSLGPKQISTNYLSSLPEDLLQRIAQSGLATRNIDSKRQASKTLRRNVAPRNTSKAATIIADAFSSSLIADAFRWKLLIDLARQRNIRPEGLINYIHLVLGKKEQNWDQKKKRRLVSKLIEVHSR